MTRHDPPSTPSSRYPIERGFPVEEISALAEKESRAKRHYRPIYTMHKWWARRLGCVFRAISLYTLVHEDATASVRAPGTTQSVPDLGGDAADISSLCASVSDADPASLWELYPKDVTIEDTRVLDPFMGGGTPLLEASRFGADVTGADLNPVAWFVTKLEAEAGQTDLATLDAAFATVEAAVAEELTAHYQTACPVEPEADHTADVMHYLWVKELDCVSCGHTVPLFSDYRVAKGRYAHSDEYTVYCPGCEKLTYVDDWQQDATCDHCHHTFRPDQGTVANGEYACRECGQKYSVTDAIAEQDGYDQHLYALEYYCGHCDSEDRPRNETKGYKSATEADRDRYDAAAAEWADATDLREYIPSEMIPEGAITAASAISGNDVFQHGYEEWADMFNDRQLLVLSTLLQAIDDITDEIAQEYLLLAFSDMLRFNNMLVGYQASRNHINDLFQTNSFAPPSRPAEANPWGTEYGMGNFQKNWAMVREGVQYASAPTERYLRDDTVAESAPFETPIGESVELHQGDMRSLSFDTEEPFDAVITDPPYYDNIIYSDVADYFYVWQKLLLEDRYDGFDQASTPRTDSIVENPFRDDGPSAYTAALTEAFDSIHDVLTDDGILVFTYQHGGEESWAELLDTLCTVGFELTRTYPISADVDSFITNDQLSVDIVVVARPIADGTRTGISWRQLRREMHTRVRELRREVLGNRELSRGDSGVMEMGACFQLYSRHHGKITHDGGIMSVGTAVSAIFELIQDAQSIDETDVFLDLLQVENPDADTVRQLCRGTTADPDDLATMCLLTGDNESTLGTWQNDQRYEYLTDRVRRGDTLTSLDKLQFLRRRFADGETIHQYLDSWTKDEELYELADRLASATGDETYQRILGDRDLTTLDE